MLDWIQRLFGRDMQGPISESPGGLEATAFIQLLNVALCPAVLAMWPSSVEEVRSALLTGLIFQRHTTELWVVRDVEFGGDLTAFVVSAEYRRRNKVLACPSEARFIETLAGVIDPTVFVEHAKPGTPTYQSDLSRQIAHLIMALRVVLPTVADGPLR